MFADCILCGWLIPMTDIILSFQIPGMIWVDNVNWLWIFACGPQLLMMNQAATQGDFWSGAHFCIMRSKVVQINGVSILMGPGEMAGWWILFTESSPIFCLPDLHQGEPKGSQWKVIASLFDRCWHKSFLIVSTSSLLLTFPPLSVTLRARHRKLSRVGRGCLKHHHQRTYKRRM